MTSEPSAEDVSVEDLASLPEFYHPVVSPDGDTVALYYDESGRNELYLLDRESGDLERVTDGEVPRNARWHLLWGGAGDRVYFHRDDAGDEQNDVMALETGASNEGADVRPVVQATGQNILLDASSDGRYLLYASDEDVQLNVFRHDTKMRSRRKLTEYAQPVGGASYDPDDEQIAYVANESDTLENRDAYVMAANGTGKRRLDVGEDGSETGIGGWFPDGERLLVDDDADDLRRVGVYDLATDEVEWLGPHEAEESGVAVSPDGRYVVATRTRRGATMPVAYDLEAGADGSEGGSEDAPDGRELDVPEGVASFPIGEGVTFADETTVVFAHSTPDERETLYEYDLATDDARTLLAPEYGDVDPGTFVDAEYVTYESEDGLEIGGLLYDAREGPARDEDAADVPGVVFVHGGPHGRASKEFDLYAQFLVSQGYAVFRPNYRGSTGRGREFKQAILGDWGGMEQADVAAGGEWLMDRDWIDEDRVAVFGGSYGGYSVYTQLTKYPDLWATGIAWIGITDLHRLYEDDMPHYRHMLRQQMGDPEENHDLWRDRSPIEHVDAVERPIFIVHGVNDVRCPVSQARMFRDALEDRGWVAGDDFEYEELGAEGHGSTDIDQKIRVFTLLSDYLDRRL